MPDVGCFSERSALRIFRALFRAVRFRPEQHLRRASDIRAVRERGRRIDCRAFTIWWKAREAEPAANRPPPPAGARVCVIASTNAVGGAVRRNRAKRRLREVFRHEQGNVPARCDLLLLARAAANDWPLEQLRKSFAGACKVIADAVQPEAC